MSKKDYVKGCLMVVVIAGFFTMIFPCNREVEIKEIKNGKILGKDVKSGEDKIFYYDTNNTKYNYVYKGDILKYSTLLMNLGDYKKRKVEYNSEMVPNYDTIYARKQREAFNRARQEMLRDTCR